MLQKSPKCQECRAIQIRFVKNLFSKCNVPFFNNNSPPSCQFLRTKYFLKKWLGKMLIEQIIEFYLRGPGSPGHTGTRIAD